jgi:hypothetical protein
MQKNTSLKRYFISSFTPKRIMLKLITNQLNAMNIKSVMPTFMLLLLIMGSGMMMILITPFDVSYAGAQGQDTSRATPVVSSSAINVTIGDLIVEGPATSIGFRILDLGTESTGPKMEISFLGNATIRGGINATDMGTLWSIMNHDGTAYSEGKGILTSKATGEMATYTFQAIGGYDPDGKLRNHGSMFFNSNTSSNGQLSFLNGMVGVFADEIDAKGNVMTKVWELR